MRKPIILLLVCLVCGCQSLNDVGWKFTTWRVDQRNTSRNRAYQKVVAKHAGLEALVGTWYRTTRTPCKTPNEWHETMSLFTDGTYIMRRSGWHGFLCALKHVSVTEGEWKKTGAGIVELSRSGQAKSEIVNLNEWTNTFVRADIEIRNG